MVFVVDDDQRVRDALSSLLEAAGLDVAVFGSASQFLAADKPDAPACLVLDLELPDVNGLELQRELTDRDAPPIVFITGHGDIPSSVRAMKGGAVEFLLKPFGDEELLAAIEAAIEIDRTNRVKRSERAEVQRRYQHLTPREREVLQFVVGGFANKNTASELGTSEITWASFADKSCARWEHAHWPSLFASPTESGFRRRNNHLNKPIVAARAREPYHPTVSWEKDSPDETVETRRRLG